MSTATDGKSTGTIPSADAQVQGPLKVLAPDFAGIPDELKRISQTLLFLEKDGPALEI